MLNGKVVAAKMKKVAGAGSETEDDNTVEDYEAVDKNKKKDDKKSGDQKGAVAMGAGLSAVTFSCDSTQNAEDIIQKLFKLFLIADAQVSTQKHERYYKKFNNQVSEPDQIKVRLVTTSKKATKAIEEILKMGPNESRKDVVDDVVAVELNSASQDYIDWVTAQTDEEQ